jgi:hypothetical protein
MGTVDQERQYQGRVILGAEISKAARFSLTTSELRPLRC